MNKELNRNYCGPRSITPEEKERLLKGKYTKFEEGDSVIFAAKQNKYDVEPAFTIEADLVTKTISFSEENTKNLEIGKYIWEMSLNKADGYRCTFIANRIIGGRIGTNILNNSNTVAKFGVLDSYNL